MTAFALKLVALLTMALDHIGYEFAEFITAYPLRVVGRLAFPIYVFLIAEGCKRTGSLEKYMLRLGAFALISEIPFNLFASTRVFYPASQNVFFTLLFGAAAVWSFEHVKKIIPEVVAAILVVAAFCIAAEALSTDYSWSGVLAVFLCYYMPGRLLQLTSLGLLFLFKYSFTPYFFAVVAALGLLWLYNGKRGRPFKWVFYMAYPIHLLLFYGIYIILKGGNF